MGPTQLAISVAAFLTGLFLGERMNRRKYPRGKIDFLIDTSLIIHEKQEIIMATIAELSAKVDELQSTIDTEQEQIAAAIAKLQETIDELSANQNDPEAINAVIAKLESAKTDLEGTVTPGEPTEEQPTEEQP